MPKSIGELIGGEVKRVDKLVAFASTLEHPILYMQLVMARNSLATAQYAAGQIDGKTNHVKGLDLGAIHHQFKDFLKTLAYNMP